MSKQKSHPALLFALAYAIEENPNNNLDRFFKKKPAQTIVVQRKIPPGCQEYFFTEAGKILPFDCEDVVFRCIARDKHNAFRKFRNAGFETYYDVTK